MAKRKWGEMTLEQKRVAVARDALKLLEARKIKADHKGYVHEKDGKGYKPEFSKKTVANGKCAVCAQGALLAGMCNFGVVNLPVKVPTSWEERYYIEQWDGTWVRDLEGGFVRSKLRTVFSQPQLEAVEQCYEGWPAGTVRVGNSCFVTEEHMDKFEKVKSPAKRLRGILGNIIKNKGTFVPEQGPVYPKKRK